MKIKLFTIVFLLLTGFYHDRDKPGDEDKKDKEHIGAWDIRNGIFIESKSNKTNLAKENWKVFYGIFPKKITQKYIKKLELISDGEYEKTGALGALNTKNDAWKLVLDPADVNFKSKNQERINQSIYTLIHEFGHLITLNNTQIRPIRKEVETLEGSYVTFEGQALKNSYINQFVLRFWSGSLLNEWDNIQKKYCFFEHESEICLEKLYGLYNENYNDFLTDYAAESPEEDIAESWTAFVLKDDKIKDPQTVAEQKINFFYQFPEFVRYRKIIRKNTRKYLK